MVGEWISVKDAMPDEGQPVLGLNTFNGLDKSFCVVVFYEELEPHGTGLEDFVWFDPESSEGGRWQRRSFGYWMPLPDPPKEVQ